MRKTMRYPALSSLALVIVTLLGGCAAPVAVHVASFAADGVAYVTTGKGTADHALSALVGENCRLSNSFKGRDICAPKVLPGDADSPVAAAFAPLPGASAFAPLPGASAFAPLAGDADVAAVSVRDGIRLATVESAGMNTVEVTGAPSGSRITGRVDDEGTLHVGLVTADGAAPRVLFTVAGYARSPGRFTGVLMGAAFFAPDSFLR